MTPLIDIIFLLLLFFMLSSTFSRFSEVPVTAPGTGRAISSEQPGALLTVRNDEFVLNGESRALEQLSAELTSLKETGAKRLMVIVEQGARSQDLVSALEAAAAADIPVSVARRGQ